MKPVLFVTAMLSACSGSSDVNASEGEAADLVQQQNLAPEQTPQSSELASIAFPSKKPIRDADGAEWQFQNHKVVAIKGSYALVSEGSLIESTGSHSTSGRLDVTYFGNPAGGYFVKQRYPEAVSVGSWGAISEWAISGKFTENPVIYASGGFTGQGTTEGCTVLTELTIDGPRTVAVVPDYYGGTSFDGEEFETEGMIRSISKGVSFEVVYLGTERGVVRYRWNGSRFETSDKAVLSHCGFE